MAKTIQLDPMGRQTSVQTNDNLLSALLTTSYKCLPNVAGGECALLPRIYQRGHGESCSLNRREQRTLEVITTCNLNSRLACQTTVLGEGVVVKLLLACISVKSMISNR